MKKIITWNINSIRKRIDHVKKLIEDENPDYIFLQEVKLEEDFFPLIEGYFVYLNCIKSFEGVAILSKTPLEIVDKIQARYISCIDPSYFNLNLINVYVHHGGSERSPIKDKLLFLDKIYKNIHGKSYQILGGDMNVYTNKNEVTCDIVYSDAEINALKEIEEEMQFKINTKPYLTWWDYRHNFFNKNKGVGIDKIYTSFDIDCGFLQVLKSYRNLTLINHSAEQKPSDHAPVLLNFKIN